MPHTMKKLKEKWMKTTFVMTHEGIANWWIPEVENLLKMRNEEKYLKIKTNAKKLIEQASTSNKPIDANILELFDLIKEI